ncbi:MAG TPA: winged helix-turn-helix domain-containing protein [Actinomycetota bacterium]|nr:winged helix-turn-helix domain-containing protein [Actinomycetota bacterium]
MSPDTNKRAHVEVLLEAGALIVEPAAYRVWFGGNEVALTSTQVELVALLIANRDRVVAREEIARSLGLRHARSVDVLLTTVRHSLGRNFVRNVRSRGWILDEASLAA